MFNYIVLFSTVCLLTSTPVFSQTDSMTTGRSLIFDRLTKDLTDYKPDTTAVPNDNTTRLIIELRALRGGFNINEAVEFKLEEDRQKKEISEAAFQKLSSFFTNGDGKKWLDNSIIWIYRNLFTYRELKGLVKFYKTPAGEKMATAFPIVMIRSLVAAMEIKKYYLEVQAFNK